MKGVLFFFLLLCVFTVQCKKQKNSDRKDIIIINDVKFFKKVMKTHTNLLVLFSQSEKEVEDKLNLLGTLAKDFKGKGSIAFVNCGEYSKLCKKFKISAKYGPVLKHYKNGKFNKDYNRKDTLKSLTTFMNNPTGDTPWEEEPGAETVRHIDGDKDLAKVLAKEKKPVFVMFYAPWCGFCKRLKPTYQEIASELKQSIILAGMDVDNAESMNTRVQFNITGFPTLIYFHGGKELYRYKGKHEKEILIEWLQNPTDDSPKDEEEEQWKDTPSEVVHLTDDTFDDYVAANPSVLVMFYAPWCGHCKAMKPEYVDAAQRMKDEDISGTLAAVDATKESALGKRFEVKGFPTVKYFKDGEFAFDMNERKTDTIVEFMKDPKEPPPPPPAEPEWSETATEINHLKDDNFKDFLKKKKHVLVMFYAPWCGHCKKAKPEFTEAAKHHAENKKIGFAAVDCTKETAVCGAHGVEGYPTFKYFNYGKNDEKYTGGRTKDDFIKFMENPQEPVKPEPEEEQWSDEPSAVEHLTDGDFEDFVSKHNSVLVMFYAPWCGHCKAMKPAYMEAAAEMKAQKVKGMLAAVNCMQEQKLRQKYEVSGFPSVKYFKDGKYAYDYPRSRTKDDLVDFMRSPSEANKNPNNIVKNDIPWSDEDNSVIHLTGDNFAEFVQSHSSVLVMFYAPWCGHCKKTKPEFETAAETFNIKEGLGKMAAVDCTQDKELCSKYDVTGYPTIKYFKEGEDSFKYFQARTAKAFTEFMTNPQPPEPEWDTIPGKVKHLTDDNIHDVLKAHKSVLVMFYSPRCGYCKTMKPDYIAAAEQLSSEGSDIVLAAMDATKHLTTAKEHVTTGYPTIKFFRNGEEIEEYEGNRSKMDIIKYVKTKDRDEDEDQEDKSDENEDKWQFQIVQELTQDNFETTLAGVEHSLVMFFAPWCGHCKNTKPHFEEAASKIQDEKNKLMAAIDCTVETELCGKENVSGYPTIKYYNYGRNTVNYENSRTSEDFLSFFDQFSSTASTSNKKEEL
ncbi:probable protein disulfide-isomerase A4 isoform X1 [Dendronephthya gigantea]|uniref:probable protein disulfide-isomerase A4 isoform X1 n=1 Tax=Dendronephthya gigantea TaxID=151771 RepID=UPI00106A232F|nr:probable protein disulfide-isomerase A4 isoform X1 [Dendronephthya gigantea]